MSNEHEHRDFFQHLPATISQGIVDYAMNVALLHSRYLFVRRVQGLQFAYCTHCRKQYTPTYLRPLPKHNEKAKCEKCDSICTVKDAWRGRKKLYDRAYFVYYDKSLVDPNSIVACGLYVVRDYSDDFTKVETRYSPIAAYLFTPGRRGRAFRCNWGSRWVERKSVRSEERTSMQHVVCTYSRDSIAAAVQGTPFQYCQWEQYDHVDMVEFFDMASKYPCIEFLTKIGLRSLVNAKLSGGDTYGVVNWRGKTPEKVLGLTRAELKEMRRTGPYGARAIRFYRDSKRLGAGINMQEARELCDIADSYAKDDLTKICKRVTVKRAYRYMLKQIVKSRHYRTGSAVLIAWRDYLRDCLELGIDTQQERNFMPNNLYEAHQETIRKVKVKKDETLNAKIASRLPDLRRYWFERDGLLIRPATSSIELFDEGKKLSHCVGGYADRYAEGKTDLLVVRRAAEPDKPFYTVEVIGGKIQQARGLKNCNPTDEVRAFLDAFVAARLTKKKVRAKIARSA